MNKDRQQVGRDIIQSVTEALKKQQRDTEIKMLVDALTLFKKLIQLAQVS